MGSSAKTEKFFFEGHRSTFWIKMQFGIGHPPPTHQLQSTCVGRAQGSQIFKRNSIISIRSKVMAFLVISLSPCGPHRPRVVPFVPMLFPHHPRCPHIVPTSSPSSPEGPHVLSMVCGLHMLSPSSLSSPHHLEGPHIMPNPPDTHSTHPPPPWGGGALNQ